MLRITKQADYAIVVTSHLARLADDDLQNAREVAEGTGLSVPMVSKILKLLGRHGLVRSTRGIHGGYALARPAEEITVVELIDALEGPVGLTECSMPGVCSLEPSCSTRHKWQSINARVRVLLDGISLAEMIPAPHRDHAPREDDDVSPAQDAAP